MRDSSEESAIMPMITNAVGCWGMYGRIPWPRRQSAAPSIPPITMPGAKIPPDPPDPMDSDVAGILANGRTSTIHSRRVSSVSARHPELHPPVALVDDLGHHHAHQSHEESADAIYARFHRKGRMLPNGLVYLDSRLVKDGDRCFQLMATSDPSLFRV